MSASDFQVTPNYLAPRMPKDLSDVALEVFAIPSTSYNEASMLLYIARCLDNKGIKYEIDNYGNMLVTKGVGPYPCFCAHLDTVHVYKNGFNIEYELLKGRDYMYATDDNKKRVGIGGDDKCGIFVCLHLLFTLDNVKVVFFSQEESGGTGSYGVSLEFFKNCKFLGGIDRWNGHDFVNHYGGSHTISKAFNKTIKNILKRFDYEYSSGFFTDAFVVMERGVGICCFNMSCGYYSHHTDKEYVDLNELYNACLLAEELAELPDQYKFEIPKSSYYKYDRGYGGFGYGNSTSKNTKPSRTGYWDKVDNKWVWDDEQKAKQDQAYYDWYRETLRPYDPNLDPQRALGESTDQSDIHYCKGCDLELLSWEINLYHGYCTSCWPAVRDEIMDALENELE